MSDERNDRPKSDDTPPPLVPPPVFSSRANDTTAVSDSADESRQVEVDRAAADARDLGTDRSSDSPPNDAGRDDRDAREVEYAEVDEPAADAVEDHTVLRDSGDLEPETDPATYPPGAVERDPAPVPATVRDEAARDDAARDEAMRNEALRDEAMRNEAARDETPRDVTPREAARDETPAETRAYDPVPVPAGTAAGTGAATSAYSTEGAYPPAPAQQRMFTPPPVEPKKKGNRGVGALIAVLSVIIFAVAYAVIAALIIGATSTQALGDTFLQFALNPLFYVPTLIFIVAFVIVVLLANRAGWWAYVLGSLLVGALVYFGTIGVALLDADVVGMTPQEATARLVRLAVDPFIVTAALVAREVSLWTGAAVASRGRRVKAKNVVARDEYERLAADHRAEYERGYPTSA